MELARRLVPAVLAGTTALSALTLSAAAGQTYIVTSLADSGPGTLRSAIGQANVSPGADTIEFTPGLSGVITLQGFVTVSQDVTIIGPQNGGIVLTGSYPLRVAFGVDSISLVNLQFVQCTFAVYFEGPTRVSINRCQFISNGNTSVVPTAGVFTGPAGFVQLTGDVRSCSFVGNIGMNAGVLWNAAINQTEPLKFVNCTFHGNSSINGSGAMRVGFSQGSPASIVQLLHCTFTSNASGTASAAARSAVNVNGFEGETVQTFAIKNCVFDGNTNSQPGTPADLTFEGNPVSPQACIFGNAMLAEVNFVGGVSVRTPLPGSPCIDAAADDLNALVDQLNVRRGPSSSMFTPTPGFSGGDIGAVEFVPQSCPADFNNSGHVTVQDIYDYLAAWTMGCP